LPLNIDWKYAVSSALLTFTKSALLFQNIHYDQYIGHLLFSSTFYLS